MAKILCKWFVSGLTILGFILTWIYTTTDRNNLYMYAWSPIEKSGIVDRDKSLASNTQVASVLLLTYMRSGSSLTGDLLQQAPNAFYVFEPLHAVFNWFKSHTNGSLMYINGTVKPPPVSRTEEALHVLYNWFTCDLTKLPEVALKDQFLNKGLKSKAIKSCLQTKSQQRNITSTDAMSQCVMQLETVCKTSPIRILKIIRMEMRHVSQFLDILPGLKIIHLVRDPRATLVSQARFGMCRRSDESIPCVSQYCARRENDVIETDRLMPSYPGRVFIVNYEDIGRHPLEMAAKLHDMIGAEYTQKAREYTFNITMAGFNNSCAICTTRTNSTEHVDEWKSTISMNLLDAIQDRCNYIMKRYNYEFVTK